jgi:hypothetical protein
LFGDFFSDLVDLDTSAVAKVNTPMGVLYLGGLSNPLPDVTGICSTSSDRNVRPVPEFLKLGHFYFPRVFCFGLIAWKQVEVSLPGSAAVAGECLHLDVLKNPIDFQCRNVW